MCKVSLSRMLLSAGLGAEQIAGLLIQILCLIICNRKAYLGGYSVWMVGLAAGREGREMEKMQNCSLSSSGFPAAFGILYHWSLTT